MKFKSGLRFLFLSKTMNKCCLAVETRYTRDSLFTFCLTFENFTKMAANDLAERVYASQGWNVNVVIRLALSSL